MLSEPWVQNLGGDLGTFSGILGIGTLWKTLFSTWGHFRSK